MEKIVFSTREIDGPLQDILKNGGVVSVCVSGYSMKPFLRHNQDTVRLKQCSDRDIKKGQIVLFKRYDGKIFLHRIRKLVGNRIVVNGDAQQWCETIEKEQVIAFVCEIERNGKVITNNSSVFKMWNLLWYPTRPFRDKIFKAGSAVKKLF